MFLDRHSGLAQLARIAAVGDCDRDDLGIDLAETAVQSYGRMQKGRLRADRAQQARPVARDVLGLADAGQMDAAAARLSGANHVHRRANLVEVDLTPKRA